MANRPLRLVMRQLRRAVTPLSAGLTDAQLLERFLASRDEAAFELLVRRHERMVLGMLRRVLRDRHAAENAFQATFLILARKASSIAKGGSVGAWLYRVGYRVALRARANAGRRTSREQPVEHVPETPVEENPAAEFARRELLDALDDELNRLPEKYRTPLVLCYLEGRTYRAAAEELHSSVGTISTWLTRGRELLRQLAGSSRSTEQLVEAVFLATLARLPTESESKFAGDNLTRKKDRLEGLRDLLFALTNTKEFTTNLEALNGRNPWRQLKERRGP